MLLNYLALEVDLALPGTLTGALSIAFTTVQAFSV